MNLLFQDLFPPQPIAYQYSNMKDNCEFGWFFRPNTSASAGAAGAASILGVQTGIVLLKTTKKDIKRLRVSGQTLSAWSNPPTRYSKKLYLAPRVDLPELKLPEAQGINSDAVSVNNLSMFPALIPKDLAKKILHIEDDQAFADFVQANKIFATNKTNDYVTNASLRAVLSSTTAATPVAQIEPNAKPAPAGGAQAPSKGGAAPLAGAKQTTTATPKKPANAKE
jgi:hypothetical protein